MTVKSTAARSYQPANEYRLLPVVIRLKSSNQYLTSVAQCFGRWADVKVVPCEGDDPHRAGWALFPLTKNQVLGGYRCLSDDLKSVQAILDALQTT